MSKLSVYHTFSFWFCIAGIFIDMAAYDFASKVLNMPTLANLFLVCMLLFSVGAVSHWYLDRLYAAKK